MIIRVNWKQNTDTACSHRILGQAYMHENNIAKLVYLYFILYTFVTYYSADDNIQCHRLYVYTQENIDTQNMLTLIACTWSSIRLTDGSTFNIMINLLHLPKFTDIISNTKYVQSSAVITQTNMTWHCIQEWRDWGRVQSLIKVECINTCKCIGAYWAQDTDALVPKHQAISVPQY